VKRLKIRGEFEVYGCDTIYVVKGGKVVFPFFVSLIDWLHIKLCCLIDWYIYWLHKKALDKFPTARLIASCTQRFCLLTASSPAPYPYVEAVDSFEAYPSLMTIKHRPDSL
jgi:hypothetical protein